MNPFSNTQVKFGKSIHQCINVKIAFREDMQLIVHVKLIEFYLWNGISFISFKKRMNLGQRDLLKNISKSHYVV